MSRQERGAMRAKVAARKAAEIIGAAYERAKAESLASPSRPQVAHEQVGEMAIAAEVKRLRDEGKLSWMAIGAKLGFPGSKNGAGTARRYYAMTGEVPRTQAPRKGSTPKPTGPASKGVPAYLRKERLVRDGHVIPRDMPDEEVEAMLVGRRVEWATDLARLTGTDPATWGAESQRWFKQEARVHPDPRWVKVVYEEDEHGREERRVYFREYLGRDKDGTLMSGPTRCVRVDAIFTVA